MSKKNACPLCGYDVVAIPASARVDLKRRRKKGKVAVAYIAREMEVSTNYIYMLENGERQFSHDLVHRYMAAVKYGNKALEFGSKA